MDQHYSFLVNQTAEIERQVYRKKYADIRYPALAMVDTSMPEWTPEILHFSMDKHGKVDYMHAQADNLPLVDIEMQDHYVRVANIWGGYRYTTDELEHARRAGINLGPEKAEMVRRAHEEFIDDVFLNGNARLKWDGFWNMSTSVVSHSMATAVQIGGGTSRLWEQKNGAQIIKDINDALSGIYTDTQTVEMANTVLLPVAHYNLLATKNAGYNTDTSAAKWLMEHNVYTLQTGRPLMIRQLRGLEGKGDSGTDRMIVYNREPEVLKFHMPMPINFGQVEYSLYKYTVPSMCRLGGLEIRRPKAIRYVDGI